jgi:hypothetical protein
MMVFFIYNILKKKVESLVTRCKNGINLNDALNMMIDETKNEIIHKGFGKKLFKDLNTNNSNGFFFNIFLILKKDLNGHKYFYFFFF